MVEELKEARQLGHQADVHRLARALAGRSTGLENRKYNRIAVSFAPRGWRRQQTHRSIASFGDYAAQKKRRAA
eukprot:6975837-Pyramimonas_sp.AAC.1